MGRSLVIQTPENVALEYPLAGLGSRFVAVAVDTALQLVLTVLLVALGLGAAWLGGLGFQEIAVSAWAGSGIALLLAVNGYFIAFETLWSGQTPGKRLVGLRVLGEGGHPLDFRGALLRNVVRLLDFLPAMYGLGVVFLFFHPEYRRLGDLAAGTFVVREREGGAEGHVTPVDTAPDTPLPVGLLERPLLELAGSFLRRREGLDPDTRAALGAEIAWRLRAAMGLGPSGPGAGWTPEELVEIVLARRATLSGL